jgi:hypothetical protein
MSTTSSCLRPEEKEHLGKFSYEKGRKIGSSSRRASVMMDRQRVESMGLGISGRVSSRCHGRAKPAKITLLSLKYTVRDL